MFGMDNVGSVKKRGSDNNRKSRALRELRKKTKIKEGREGGGWVGSEYDSSLWFHSYDPSFDRNYVEGGRLESLLRGRRDGLVPIRRVQ